MLSYIARVSESLIKLDKPIVLTPRRRGRLDAEAFVMNEDSEVSESEPDTTTISKRKSASQPELNSSTKNRVSCIRVLGGYVFVYVFSCIY